MKARTGGDMVAPLIRWDPVRPYEAADIAGGPLWFSHALTVLADGPRSRMALKDLPHIVRERISSSRPRFAGLSLDLPRIMGIVNVTPDSFSDGGLYSDVPRAVEHGLKLASDGADILDIGGESTRPGAEPVPAELEAARVVPVIRELRKKGLACPISVDTRKASVAQEAIEAGANIVNDVSAVGFDNKMCATIAQAGVSVCLMHAQGSPETMQHDPAYDDVVREVSGFLLERVELLVSLGVARGQILIDPGIGFGKTLDHNLALMRDLGALHAIGCGILFGASRKSFIARVSAGARPASRLGGSLASALWALSQGAQVLRVHDVVETRQAISVWQALVSPQYGETR